jgi:hypothetical protein
MTPFTLTPPPFRIRTLTRIRSIRGQVSVIGSGVSVRESGGSTLIVTAKP